ncbi:MAG: DUF6036 family nucleotidyltransferase [Bacillota bacterium]
MSGMIRKDLLERLSRLDEDASLLFDGDERFHLVIVGGGALILLERISRATHDVDAISASRELLGLLEKYDINCRVQTYINNFPFNYEDRLVPLNINGRKIDFYTASLEDIVIAKLYSARAIDKKDVENKEVVDAINWNMLERLAMGEDEAKASALNERCYKDFKANYDDYVRRFRT